MKGNVYIVIQTMTKTSTILIVFVCDFYTDLRKLYIKKYLSMAIFSDLLNLDSLFTLKKTGKYVYKCPNMRDNFTIRRE